MHIASEGKPAYRNDGHTLRKRLSSFAKHMGVTQKALPTNMCSLHNYSYVKLHTLTMLNGLLVLAINFFPPLISYGAPFPPL